MAGTTKNLGTKTCASTRHTYQLTLEPHPTIRGCQLAKITDITKTSRLESGVYPVEILLWAAEKLAALKKPFRGP